MRRDQQACNYCRIVIMKCIQKATIIQHSHNVLYSTRSLVFKFLWYLNFVWQSFLYMNIWPAPWCWYYRSVTLLWVMTCNWSLFYCCCFFFRKSLSGLFCKALTSCSKCLCWMVENGYACTEWFLFLWIEMQFFFFRGNKNDIHQNAKPSPLCCK